MGSESPGEGDLSSESPKEAVEEINVVGDQDKVD